MTVARKHIPVQSSRLHPQVCRYSRKAAQEKPSTTPSDVLPRNWYLPFSPSYISDQNLTYFLLFIFLFKSDIRFSSFSSHHPAVSHSDGRRPTCQREHPSLVRTNFFLTLDVGFFVFDSFPGFSVQRCDLPGETLQENLHPGGSLSTDGGWNQTPSGQRAGFCLKPPILGHRVWGS